MNKCRIDTIQINYSIFQSVTVLTVNEEGTGFISFTLMPL